MSGQILFHTQRRDYNTRRSQWNLTDDAFNSLLSALSDDRDAAADKYLRIRTSLTRYFAVRGIASADSAADEVLDRLAKKISAGAEIEVVDTYALGIARMVVLELHKTPELKSISDIREFLPVKTDCSNVDEDETRLACLDGCLATLSDSNRDLIVGYYSSEKREKIEIRQHIADRLGVTPNALRNRAVRIRRKLEDCVKSCLRN
jgi:DNA-directed RNA polymerase specialized sigma24 family protein